MGFKALTVNTAAEAAGHIYAEDDAAIFQSMFGGDGVLNIGNCLKSTVISNNKVRISDGVLSVGGHIGRLSHADYQDMTIENGATGYNRNDIIYARFLTSGNVDSFILAVKKGTATTGIATDPSLVQGNLYEGAVERDYPLYRVKLSGLSISSVDQLFTVIPTIPDLKAQMEKDKAEINQSLKNTVDLTTYDAFAAGVNKEFDTYAEYALNNPSGDIFAIWDMRLEIFRSYARIHGAVTPKAALGDATHLYGLFNLTNYGIKPKGSGVTVIPFDYPIAKFTHVDGDNNIYCNPLFFKINPTGYVEGCVDKYNLVKNTGYCDITFPIVFIA